MRKIYFLALLMLAVSMVGIGENRYLPFSKQRKGYDSKEQSIIPVRNVINGNNGSLEVSYMFPGANAVDKEVSKIAYSFLHVDGFGQTGQVGAPSLPMRNDMYVFTKDENPVIQVVDSEYIEVEGFTMHPTLDFALDTEGAPEPEFKKDDEVYGKNSFYPGFQAKLVQNQIMRDTRIVKVQVCPVQYNPVTKKLRLYSKIVYRINGGNGKVYTDMNPTAVSVLKNVALNGDNIEETSMLARESADMNAKDYLILTHKMFEGPAKRLANWKASLGYKVELISKEKWTTAMVRSEISHRYHNMTPKPKYFVLVGDNEQIPAMEFKSYKDDPFFSDLPYACMDGKDDFTPDMAKGRISVRTLDQANVVINKIINYEKDPVADASFYEKGLNCAQFQDDEKDGFATRRFCHTSEDIRKYVVGQGYQVERIYYADKSVNPTNFNNGSFSQGEPIAPELLKKNGFNWNGGKTEIVNSINDGRFYVFHRDHGYSGGIGWAHPKFVTSQISELHNGNKLPVVFSINCHTGEFSYPECFAEGFLRKKNGGAVAVFGASLYSLSGPNDGLSLGMIESIWPEPGILPSFGSGSGAKNPRAKGFDQPTTRLGDVLNLGLLRMNETWAPNQETLIYTYRLFHLFGDPAMRMWTMAPQEITGTLPKELKEGQRSLDLAGISKDGAMVTLVSEGEILAKGVVQYGKCHLDFSPLKKGKKVDLTISALNSRPLYKSYSMDADKVAPIAEVLLSTKRITAGSKLALTASVTGSVDKYKWSFSTDKVVFEAPSTSSSAAPTVVFSEEGIYDITLEVNNKYGSNKTVLTKAVQVIPALAPAAVGTISPKPNNFGMGIYKFTLGKFSNSSNSVNREPGYMDFTQTTDIISTCEGERYPMSVKTGDTNPVKALVFIDKNADGNWTDDELIAQKASFLETFTTELTIDDTYTKDKPIRIRVMTEYSKNPLAKPSDDIQYGQVEDYMMVVHGALQQIKTQPAEAVGFKQGTVFAKLTLMGNPNIEEKGFYYGDKPGVYLYHQKQVVENIVDNKISFELTALTEGTAYFYRPYMIIDGEMIWGEEMYFVTYGNRPDAHVTDFKAFLSMSKQQPLSWNAAKSTNAIHGYLIKIDTDKDAIDNPKDGVVEKGNAIYMKGSNTDFAQISGLTPNTNYFYKIFPYANDGKDILYYTDGAVPLAEAKTLEYGKYLPINVKYSFLSFINYLKLANVSNSAKRSGGENDFKALEINICPDRTYTLTLKGSGFMSYKGAVMVWFDWDQDGFFDSSEGEMVYSDKGAFTVNHKITVPKDAKTGKTYLRVCYANESEAFNSFSSRMLAAYEDYTVNIDSKYDPIATWNGTTSSVWSEATNWEGGALPKQGAQITIKSGANNPIIDTEVNCDFINIAKGASLIVAKSGTLNTDSDIYNNGELTVNEGAVNVSGTMFVAADATLSMNKGTIETVNIRQSADELKLQGTYNFNEGTITVHNSFFCAAEGFKSRVGENFVLEVGGSLALNDYSWEGGFFKGTLRVIKGRSTHYVTTFATKTNALTVSKFEVNAPGEKVYLVHKGDEIEKTITVMDKCSFIAGEIYSQYGDIKGEIVKTVNAISIKNVTINKDATVDLSVSSVALGGVVDGDGHFNHSKASVQAQLQSEDLILNIPCEFGGFESMGDHKVVVNKPFVMYDLRRVSNMDVNATEVTLPAFSIGNPFAPAKPTIFHLNGSCSFNQVMKSYKKSTTIKVERDGITYTHSLNATAKSDEHGVVHYIFEEPTADYVKGRMLISTDKNAAERKFANTVAVEGVVEMEAQLQWGTKEDGKVWEVVNTENMTNDLKVTLGSKTQIIAILPQAAAPKVAIDDASGVPAHITGVKENVEFHLNDRSWCHCVDNQEIYLNGANTLTVRYEGTDKIIPSMESADLDNVDDVVNEMVLSNTEVNENDGDKALIGQFNAVGADDYKKSATTIVASLPAGVEDNDLFVIEDNKLYEKASFDFETKDSYTISVNFSDAKMASHKYCIDVKDVNESPVLVKIADNEVAENEVGDIAITVNDPDVAHGDVLTWILKEGVVDNDLVELSEKEGVLHLQFKDAPDFETTTEVNPVIVVTDNSGLSLEIPVAITVSDVKELPKDIELSKAIIDENAAVGEKITLTVVDDDKVNGDHTITLVSIAGENKELFELKNNELVVKNPVIFYPGADSKIIVSLSVTEEGVKGSASIDKTIDINDINEAPKFINTKFEGHVQENKDSGIVVKELRAIDPEADQVSFALAAGAPDAFIVKDNFLIVNKSMDFEDVSAYDVEVEAADPQGLKSAKSFNIIVDNMNDMPIAVMNEIADKVQAGTDISLDATKSNDEDEGTNLTYTWKIIGLNATIDNADKSTATLHIPAVQKETDATIVLEVSDGKETSTVYHYIKVVTESTAVGDKITMNVDKVYPNPCTDHFKVTLQSELIEEVRITLINNMGSTVWSKLMNAKEKRFDVNVPAGIYFVKIERASSTSVQKLIVK
ncbi:T9SS type A sorting domain-containing protein [Halosquirtibacter xylanolyticus]|uniref:C25 family cysteine peptidase n=1 Tax=Halosquirtibacter xylanolyticus TaxID=3374599 RepID=UPI003747D96E|nr:T9SS type A sorting domain-containing protein [Prolixibacteraceae bacterium]